MGTKKPGGLTPGFLVQNYLIILIAILKGYNKYVIIALISMRGGEFMRELINFIIAVTAQVAGNLLCKWLYSKLKDDN